MPQDLFPEFAPYPRSMLGWDGVDFRVIAVDDAGRIITNAGVIPFNYEAYYTVQTANFGAAAGANTLLAPVIGAGDFVVITSISAYDITSAVTSVSVGLFVGGLLYPNGYMDTPAINEPAIFTGRLALPAGHRVGAQFEGCVAGDTIYLSGTGYHMDIG